MLFSPEGDQQLNISDLSRREKERPIVIIGDSMIKHINPKKTLKETSNKEKLSREDCR